MNNMYIVLPKSGDLFSPTILTKVSGADAKRYIEELKRSLQPAAVFAEVEAEAKRALDRHRKGRWRDAQDACQMQRCLTGIEKCVGAAHKHAARGRGSEAAEIVRMAALEGYLMGWAHRTEDLRQFETPAKAGIAEHARKRRGANTNVRAAEERDKKCIEFAESLLKGDPYCRSGIQVCREVAKRYYKWLPEENERRKKKNKAPLPVTMPSPQRLYKRIGGWLKSRMSK